LLECRAIPRALNDWEPRLPLFDAAKVEKLPYEDDVERLLAEHAAKPKRSCRASRKYLLPQITPVRLTEGRLGGIHGSIQDFSKKWVVST
jgi:hypothetical protein